MKVWKYTYDTDSIQVTLDDDRIEFFINEMAIANSKQVQGYVTLDGTLPDGHSVCVSVGNAIPGGCKALVAGKVLPLATQ